MRYARYLRLEKYIAASDTGGIIERWKYGRRLLEDDTATTRAGNLKHGVLARLTGQAAAGGITLPEREIQRRLQCAKTYPTEAQIRRAIDGFRNWSALYDAGFPPVEMPSDAEPFDPRDADEKARDAARELARRSEPGGRSGRDGRWREVKGGVSQYRKLERDIRALDTTGLVKRWKYARRLLDDPTATTSSGNLRNGVLQRLIDSSLKDGIKISRREIGYRLQFAKAYPTAAHVRQVLSEFENWSSLREAGFPPVELPPDASGEDLDTSEAEALEAAKRLLDGAAASDSLFPSKRFDEFSSLTDLAKYAREMAELTERFHRRDLARAEYLQRLIGAANGDMSATWGDADAALGP